MNKRELEPYRKYVADGLTRYAKSKPVAAALVLATELMNFQPIYGWTKEVKVQEQLHRLARAGVTPRDLLARVIEFYAHVDSYPHRFESQRVEHFALARIVLTITPQGTWRPGAHLLNLLGGMVADELGAFAIMFLRRLQADKVARSVLKREALDWSTTELVQFEGEAP